jgi:hypothetical protein
MLLPPPLRRCLSPVPRFLFSPPFRATSTTLIGIFKLVASHPPHPAPAPANSPTPAPAPASTSPGGRIASMDVSASGSAPLGLMALVADEEYDSRNFVGLRMRMGFSTLGILVLVNLTTALLPTRPVLMRQLYQPLLPPLQRWDRPFWRPLCPAVILRSIVPIRLRQFLRPFTPFLPGCLNVQLLLAQAVILPLLTLVPQIICQDARAAGSS